MPVRWTRCAQSRWSGSPSVGRGLRRSATKPSHAAVRLCRSQAQGMKNGAVVSSWNALGSRFLAPDRPGFDQAVDEESRLTEGFGDRGKGRRQKVTVCGSTHTSDT